MKRFLSGACIGLLLAMTCGASATGYFKSGHRPLVAPAGLDLTAMCDANNLNMLVTNIGSFAYDDGGFYGKNDGLYYPARDPNLSDNTSVIYAGGIWMGATVGGEIRVAVAEYSQDFGPGPMVGSAPAPDDPKYHVYKIVRGDTTSADYVNWPAADGAPVDENGKPLLLGDQTLWSVCNDADPSSHNSGATKPLGVELQETVFGFARTGPLGNCIFVKFKIINKGSNLLENAYVSCWADPDLGGAADDLVGCDRNLSLGYCYNATNADNSYKDKPPAVGYDFFQGPIVPSPGDTATVSGRKIPDYMNLPMTSFNKYINGTDPETPQEIYNYMQGLQSDGSPLVNPVTNTETKYFVDGDPVSGTGWLDDTPADRRYMQSAGPFTMSPGDTQEVVIGIIVGQGSDRLTSVTALKFYDDFAQTAFRLNFDLPAPPAPPVVKADVLDGEVVLSWGKESEETPGDFPFQGYNVWQSRDGSQWKRIATYDVADGAALIFDNVFDLESGVVVNKPVEFGSDGGIKRYYITSEDKIRGGALHNMTDYFYAVTAYSYDANQTPKTLENPQAATKVSLTPQTPIINNDFPTTTNQALPDSQLSGVSDGGVQAFVINPLDVTGHTYRVEFVDDEAGGVTWQVRDLEADSLVVVAQSNQTGDEDYPIFGGIQVKVTGPPPGMKDWDIPAGNRRFTFSGGANAAGLEGFEGAMGWASPCWFFANCEDNGVSADQIVSVVLKLATADVDGNFSPDDPNVSYGYRYLRLAQADPAKPEFGPFIKNKSGSYVFQDFEKSIPLSAWNVDVDPPQRLAVGFLENNVEGGSVDGKWWPPDYTAADNYSVDGPREWLFVYKAPYTESPVAEYEGSALTDQLPVMYMSTASRRGSVPFSPDSTGEDQFEIFANHVNTVRDSFLVFTPAPTINSNQLAASKLDDIRVVPNPYYNNSGYDVGQNDHRLRFHHLPAECTIRIFNLAGELVKTIKKDDPSSNWAEWDLLTEAKLPCAPGVYLYMVDAKGIGTHFGKLAIFVEREQLNTF